MMCYFLLAEWNEISGKYLSHTAGGLESAHVTYGGWCVLLHVPLPTCFPALPPLHFKFSASWLSNSLYVCVQICCWVWNKGMAVRVSHGYQWCVRNKQWNDTLKYDARGCSRYCWKNRNTFVELDGIFFPSITPHLSFTANSWSEGGCHTAHEVIGKANSYQEVSNLINKATGQPQHLLHFLHYGLTYHLLSSREIRWGI